MTHLDRDVEIKILTLLSDFLPRNQKEITDEIGRDGKKSTDRVKVHRAIRRNVKFLKRSMPKMEDNGKVWVLRKDIGIIKKIVDEYPELFSHFQVNETVLVMLVDKHVNQVCPDEWLSDAQELDFKNRLMISATFFRLYLSVPADELLKIMDTLFSITEMGQEFERRNRGETWQVPKPPPGFVEKCGFTPYKPSFNAMLDVTFGICVGADVLNQKECQAGLDLIKKIKPLDIAGGT